VIFYMARQGIYIISMKHQRLNEERNSPFVISWSGVRLSPPAPETKLLVYESLRPTLTVVQ